MGPSDKFNRAVTLLQEAATGHVGWSDAAGPIHEVTGTRGSALAFGTGHSQVDAEWFYLRIFFRGRIREDLASLYLEDYWPEDERIPRLARMRPGQLVKCGDLFTEREKKTSRIFNEALPDLEARDGRIVAANDRARTLLREGDRLRDERGFLRIRVPSEHAELSRLLQSALPPFGTCGAAGSMMFGRAASRGPLVLHVNPVRRRQRHTQTRRVAALVLILDPAAPPSIDPALVELVLGLTPTESRLAVALAAGQRVQEVALSTGRTEQTVRWHMKRIFRKQGVARQVDLVRRVLRLGACPTLDRYNRQPEGS